MASAAKGSSDSSIPRTELIRAIENTIATPLTALSKAEADPLRVKVITLFKQLKKSSRTSAEEKETESLKDRISVWSKTLPAAAAAAAAAAGSTALMGGGKATSTSKKIDPHLLTGSYKVLHDFFGSAESCIPYIIRSTILLALSWGNPKTGREMHGVELLEDALCSLEKGPDIATEKFREFFAFMKMKMREKEPYVDTVFTLGLQACEAGRLDVILNPLQKIINEETKGGSGGGKATSGVAGLATSDTPAVLNKRHLEKAYDAGCTAAASLGHATYSLSHIITGFFSARLSEMSSYVAPKTFEMARHVKLQKRRPLLRMLDEHPTYKKIPPAERVPVYLKVQTAETQLLAPEIALQDLYSQFEKFNKSQKDKISAITRDLAALEGLPDGPARLAIEFRLLTEQYETLLTFTPQMLSFLDEFIVHLELVLHARELIICRNMLIYDPSVDWSIIGAEGFIPFLEAYKEAHPRLNFSMLPADLQAAQFYAQEIILKTKKTIALLKAVQEHLKKTGHSLEELYKTDLVRLKALHTARMVSVDRAGRVSFTLPSKVDPLDDGYDNIVSLPDLPTAATIAAGGAVTKAEPRVEKASGGASDAGATGGIFRKLKTILLEARAHNRFTTPPARAAFSNALHYAEALCILIEELDKKKLESQQLANLQEDIGSAAFYACEQLLTAILHEKLKTASPAAFKELYSSLGHRLMGRFLEGGLSRFKELQVIIPIIRKLEGMGIAVVNPSFYVAHPLLNNLVRLQKEGSMEAAPRDQRQALLAGQEALKAFFYLLVSQGLETRIPLDRMDAQFRTLTEALTPSESAGASDGGSGGASARGSTTLSDARISEGARIITTALKFSKAFETTEQRRLVINHNLSRLNYFLADLKDASKLPLFPFYANQVRFLLRNVLEEFLCAACESQNCAIDQKVAKHDLALLAKQIKLFSRLDAGEKKFLEESAGARNEARYGTKPRAHFLEASASSAETAATAAPATASIGAAGEEGSEGFTFVLSGSYEQMLRLIAAEMAMAVTLCGKIALHSFKE